jgi:HSP20 family protein
MGQLTEWRPFAAPSLLDEPFAEMFRRFFHQQLPAMKLPEGIDFQPKVNVTETPEAYVVKAELPGVKAEEVKVTLTDDVLTISGEKKKEETRTDKDQTHIYECSYGSFLRSFTFPGAVEKDGVTAEGTDGVITITVKKSKESRARVIPVKAAGNGNGPKK